MIFGPIGWLVGIVGIASACDQHSKRKAEAVTFAIRAAECERLLRDLNLRHSAQAQMLAQLVTQLQAKNAAITVLVAEVTQLRAELQSMSGAASMIYPSSVRSS